MVQHLYYSQVIEMLLNQTDNVQYVFVNHEEYVHIDFVVDDSKISIETKYHTKYVLHVLEFQIHGKEVQVYHQLL